MFAKKTYSQTHTWNATKDIRNASGHFTCRGRKRWQARG